MNAITNIFTRKTKIILFSAVVVYMAALAATDTYHQYTYARNLSIRGVVVAIQWKTHNHALPKFVIMEKTGKSDTRNPSYISARKSCWTDIRKNNC